MSDVGLIEYDKLEDGTNLMYKNENLTSVECPFPNLKNGTKMFSSCSSLTDVNISDLSKLENGNMMFYIPNFADFKCDLPSLKYGGSMFMNYNKAENENWTNTAKLRNFAGDLSNLVDGKQMFCQQSKLYNFTTPNLKNLKSGYQMFWRARLSFDSVVNIVNALPDINHLDRDNDADWIYELNGETRTIEKEKRGVISINSGIIGSSISDGLDIQQMYDIQPYLDSCFAKGWYVHRGDENTGYLGRTYIPFVYKNELSLKVEKYTSGSFVTTFDTDLIVYLSRHQGEEGYSSFSYSKQRVNIDSKYLILSSNWGKLLPVKGSYMDDGTSISTSDINYILAIHHDWINKNGNLRKESDLSIYFDVYTNKSDMTVNFKSAARRGGATGKYRVYVNNGLVSEVG